VERATARCLLSLGPRFLRAQRLAGALVNCYVPIARDLSIAADTSLPLLLSTDGSPDQALLRRWLADTRRDTEGKRRRYSLEEVRRITETMLDAEHTP
jgi:hypothetical protein